MNSILKEILAQDGKQLQKSQNSHSKILTCFYQKKRITDVSPLSTACPLQ
jgi:hypothetical protein